MSFNPYQAQIEVLTDQIAQSQLLLEDTELGPLAQQEITHLNQQKAELEKLAAEYEENLTGSANSGLTVTPTNCIIEVRQGAGGDEANIWANDLLRMYLRFCDKVGLKVEYLDDQVIKIKSKTSWFSDQAEAAGAEVKPLVADLTTPYNIFKYESGVHRVQRVPATEAQGRIHTSTASVAVLPEVSAQAVTIRPDELDWQFVRAGGAGGQNVNKVNSAVRLTHVPSGIVVTARQERTQGANREIALDLLRAQLWEIEEEKRIQALGEARSAIGRAQRAEKIRTYNYPQNRVTDHRINQSWHDLDQIVAGKIEDIIVGLVIGLNQPKVADQPHPADPS